MEFLPLKVNGTDVKQNRTFSVNANQTDTVHVNIKSGVAFIGAQKGGALMDATVTITGANSTKSVAASRTYTSDKNNPRKFILVPG